MSRKVRRRMAALTSKTVFFVPQKLLASREEKFEWRSMSLLLGVELLKKKCMYILTLLECLYELYDILTKCSCYT